MNIGINTYSLQVQKTSLQFDARLEKVDESYEPIAIENKNEKNLENQNVSENPLLLNENELIKSEKLKKNILQRVLGGFGLEANSFEFIPSDAFKFSYENSSTNPYSKSLELSANSMSYRSHEEYYEKTNFEFSGEVIVNTPNGKYSLELNFSYTNEYYEKNVQEVEAFKEELKTPFLMNIDNDEYENELKNLKGIDILLDVINEKDEQENRSLFDYLKEQMIKDQKDKKAKDELEEKKMLLNNFKAYIKEEDSSYTLAAIRKDDIAMFFANVQNESLSMNIKTDGNSSLVQASYSKTEVSFLEIKA